MLPLHDGKTYIVAVDPPPGTSLDQTLVPNISVTAGGETPLGAVVLPMYASEPNRDE